MKKSVHGDAQQVLLSLLIEARKKAGLTQQDVADRLDKPQSFVAKYENGERRLDVIEFLQITAIVPLKIDRALKAVKKTLGV